MKLSYFLLGLFVFTLMSCGGGGGSNKGGSTVSTSSSASSQIPNIPPTVIITSPSSAEINDAVTLIATATDASGSVTYNWIVEAGPTLTLSDSTKAQISFTAPNVTQDTDVTLSVTVTDTVGASTKATAKITILSKKSPFTINGFITEGSLANAEVVATIRDLAFKTKSDSSGHYSIPLLIDEGHLSDIVLITAQGSEAQAKVKLASLLQSVNTLVSQAGDDRVLDVTENFGVNVTSVSTAQYALATSQARYGIPQIIPANEMILAIALENVHPDTKLQLAAIIKLVADSGLNLPEGINSTLDLALNPNAVNDLITSVSSQSPDLIDKTVSEIINNKNVVAEKNVFAAGTYLLQEASGVATSEITFNADLTGELYDLHYEKSAFTWSQQSNKVVITFNVPIDARDFDFPGAKYKTAELSTTFGFTDLKVGGWRKIETYVDNEGVEAEVFDKSYNVRVLNVSKAIKVEAGRFSGNWVDGQYNIQFNSNGALTKSLLGTAQVTSTSTWLIDANKLVVKSGEEGSVDYYFTGDLGVGYIFTKVVRDSKGYPQSIYRDVLIKQQENLALKKSDMVGIWAGGNSFVDIYSNDDLSIANFGAGIRPWNFIDGQNSWEGNIYNQDGYSHNTSCNSASKSPCTFYIKNEFKVIARADNYFYTLHKTTSYESNNIPYGNYFELQYLVKLPAIKAFGEWIYATDQYYYQQSSAGVKVWNFVYYKLFIANKSLDFWQINNQGSEISYKTYNGKLRYTRDNVKRELELKSATDKGLTVCEYDEGGQCAAGTEFFLSNRSPANISLKVIGSGSIQKSLQTAENSLMLFGNVASYKIIPDSGYEIQSVIGCGGKVEGYGYVTAEVRDSCTITAIFIQKSLSVSH